MLYIHLVKDKLSQFVMAPQPSNSQMEAEKAGISLAKDLRHLGATYQVIQLHMSKEEYVAWRAEHYKEGTFVGEEIMNAFFAKNTPTGGTEGIYSKCKDILFKAPPKLEKQKLEGKEKEAGSKKSSETSPEKTEEQESYTI